MEKILGRIKLALNKTIHENTSENSAQQTITSINKKTKNKLNETSCVDKQYVDVLYKKRDYAESDKNGSLTDETPSLEGIMIESKRNGGGKTTGVSDIKDGHVKFSLNKSGEESIHKNNLKKCKPNDVLSKINSNTTSGAKSNGDKSSILRSYNSSRATYTTASVTCGTNASDRSESEELESKLSEDIHKLTICKVFVEKRLNAFMESRKQSTMNGVESGEHPTVTSRVENGNSCKHEEGETVRFEKGDTYVNTRNLVVDIQNEFDEKTGENTRKEERHFISVRSDRVDSERTIPVVIQNKISTNRCGINSVLQVDSKFGLEVASTSVFVSSTGITARDPVDSSEPSSAQGHSSFTLGRKLSRKTNYMEKNKRKSSVTGSSEKKVISWLNCEEMTSCSLTKFSAVYNPEEKKDVQLGWMNTGYLMRHDSREMMEEMRGNGIEKRRLARGSRTGSNKKRSVKGDNDYLIIEGSPEKRERRKREEIRRARTGGPSCVSGGRNIEVEMVEDKDKSASRRKETNSIRMKVNKNAVTDEGCRKRGENSPQVHNVLDNRGNRDRGEVLNLEANKELQRCVVLNEAKCKHVKDKPTLKKKCESALKLSRNTEFRRVNQPVNVNIVTVKQLDAIKRSKLETGTKLGRHSDFKGLANKRIFKTSSLREPVKMNNGYVSREPSVGGTNRQNQVNMLSDHESIQCASDTANKNERNIYGIIVENIEATRPRGWKDCQHSRSNGSVALLERNPIRQQRGRSLNASSKRELMNIVTPRAVTNYVTSTKENKTLQKNETEWQVTSKSKVHEESVTADMLNTRVNGTLIGCIKGADHESENVNESVDLQMDISGNMLHIDTHKGFRGVVHNSYVEIMNGIWKENLELKNMSAVEPMHNKSVKIDKCFSKNVTEVVHTKKVTDTNVKLEKNAAKKQLEHILTLTNRTDEPFTENIGGHDKNDTEEAKCSNWDQGEKFNKNRSQNISEDVPPDQQHFQCNAFGKTIEINIERRGIFLLDRCIQNFVQTKANSVTTEVKEKSISTLMHITDLANVQSGCTSGCAEENGVQKETLDANVLKTEESLKNEIQTSYLRLVSQSPQKLLSELDPSVNSDKHSGAAITPAESLPTGEVSKSETIPHIIKIKRTTQKHNSDHVKGKNIEDKKHENVETKSNPENGKESGVAEHTAEEQKSAKLKKRPVHVCNKSVRSQFVKRKDIADPTVTSNSEANDDTLSIKKKKKINFQRKYRLVSKKKSNEGKPPRRKPSWKHVNVSYGSEEDKCETRENPWEGVQAKRPIEELLADIPQGVQTHNENNTRNIANNAMLVRKRNMTWNNLDQRLLFSNLDEICKEIDERLVLYLTQLGEMLPRVALKDLFDKDFNLRSIKELDVTTFTTKTDGTKYPFHTENQVHEILFPRYNDDTTFCDNQLKVQGENPENLHSKLKQYLLCQRQHNNECELNEDLKNKFVTAETFGNLKAPNEKYIDNRREAVDVLCGKEKQMEHYNAFLDEWANKGARDKTDEFAARKKQSLDILFHHGGVQLNNNELPRIESNDWEETFARSNDAWKFDSDKNDTTLSLHKDQNVQREQDLFGNQKESASYKHFAFCNAREFELDQTNATRLILNQYKPNVNFTIKDGVKLHQTAASEDVEDVLKITAHEDVSNKSPQPSMNIDTNDRKTNADRITGILGCASIETNIRQQVSTVNFNMIGCDKLCADKTVGTSECKFIDNASQLTPNEPFGSKRQELEVKEKIENGVGLQNMLIKTVKAFETELRNTRERNAIGPTEVGTSKTHAERVTVKPKKHKREKFHFVKKGEKKETENNVEQQQVFDIEDKSSETQLQANVKRNKAKSRKKKKAKYEECLEMYASLPSHFQKEEVSCIWRSQQSEKLHDKYSEEYDEFHLCETTHMAGTINRAESHNSFSDCLEWGSHSSAKSNSNKLKLKILKGLGRKVSKRRSREYPDYDTCSNIALIRVTTAVDESSWKDALDAWSQDDVRSYENALLTMNKNDNVERFVSCTDVSAERRQIKPSRCYYSRMTTFSTDSDDSNEQFQDAMNFVSK